MESLAQAMTELDTSEVVLVGLVRPAYEQERE
jgi:hypothetical protein